MKVDITATIDLTYCNFVAANVTEVDITATVDLTKCNFVAMNDT